MPTLEEKNLLNLIKTGEPANITIALQIIKGNKKYAPVLQQYKYLYEWLVKHKILKETYSIENKIRVLANQFKATFKLDDQTHPVKVPSKILKSLYLLFNLRELQLVNQGINRLPESIGELDKLVILNCEGNKLTKLPKTTSGLVFLNTLLLGKNSFKQFPIAITQFENLQQLSLEKNKLVALPEEIGGLKQLSRLNLNGNELEVFPASMSGLINLEELFLEENNLNELPKNITGIKNLRTLHLQNNSLINLPTSIKNLTRLEAVYLSDNKIKYLPEEIKLLANLKWLDLSGNPISAQKVFELKRRLPNCKIKVGDGEIL